MAINQKEHWDKVYVENDSFFGEAPSIFCVRCADGFKMLNAKTVLELGPGQGRDTKYLLNKGFSVIAADYSESSCTQLRHMFGDKLIVIQADLREGIDLPPSSVDVCYAHMLLTMDFTDEEVKKLLSDIKKALIPGGHLMFSVRNINDSDFQKGENLHDNVWENENGFAVRYYSQDDVQKICGDFEIVRINEFNEGRKVLYGVVLKKPIDY